MRIRKAVITAAGPSQRGLPQQNLVDRDGVQKTALRIVIEEATSAGVEEVCIVHCPGDREAYAKAAGDVGARLTFVPQESPRGYGHAVYCAREFVAGDPFLHLVSDHLHISQTSLRCAQQVVQVAERENCAVSAVQATRESMLPYYGTVGGTRVSKQPDLYTIERGVEKPTPTEAEQSLIVPGLRAGRYLCFFGIHVLTPAVMDLLAELIEKSTPSDRLQLSDALNRLAGKERYLALEVRGQRYNIGVKYGLLMAQLALGFEGQDRDEILTLLVELLATRQQVRS